jgi:hypothetical protein
MSGILHFLQRTEKINKTVRLKTLIDDGEDRGNRGSVVIPADSVFEGMIFKIEAWGTLTNHSDEKFEIRLRLGGKDLINDWENFIGGELLDIVGSTFKFETNLIIKTNEDSYGVDNFVGHITYPYVKVDDYTKTVEFSGCTDGFPFQRDKEYSFDFLGCCSDKNPDTSIKLNSMIITKI